MRWLTLGNLLLLTACGASELEQQRLHDGSFSVICQLSMDECVRRVQDQCKNQRYRIIDGGSETRLRDAPPFEKVYHTSRLHFACTDDGGKALISLGSDSPAADATDKKAPAARTCAAGETRECVGPGACKGGQACTADGQGFSSCDCGAAAPAPPAATDTSAPLAPTSTGGTAPSAPAP